ncbi:rhophilin-2-B-like [Mizuhopecten yessoensis]|uniref:Rhophilin-2-B n=1 Tax=Mizuhopecten yessoensis TaxID=6573 RepID=A0A210PXV6_MIZYE|nr:rhophilin-2-B-like [Mizuhopecten yessoensis]OWF41315.1 Rhophilin-2-B [Mizuhopecten yessoensis]
MSGTNTTVHHARKGSDPLVSTARGKLQTKRSKINDQINRELRMRNGAENLFRATSNKRLKELVAVELSFFNSNIQLLKEELSELNSSVEVYQHDSDVACVPMIPLGLKETTECDLTVPLKDFISEHYSEDSEKYTTEIQELLDLRQAIRTPQRNEDGVNLLTEYFNQLYYVERRFFPPDRVLGSHFHWYDSLTGVPNTQKTMGFEKGSVLFNIAALHTQIGCKEDRTNPTGLQYAINSFQKAAGTFRYLHNHFSNAPSMDMQPQTLTMMVQLMMSQAQECVFESKVFGGVEGILAHVKAAQEAIVVSQMYDDTQVLMASEPLKDYIPYSWLSMTQVKSQYYMAIAHEHMASAILNHKDNNDHIKLGLYMAAHQNSEVDDDNNKVETPRTDKERLQHGKAHLKEALMSHEEALRLHDLCKQLRKIDSFVGILKPAHESCLQSYSSLEEEDDFTEIYMSPKVAPKSERPVSPTPPEFTKVKVTDIFQKLGPVLIFNAKNEWSAPRTVVLDRSAVQGFGFSVRGDCPVKVAEIEVGSVAEASKLKVGDFVVAVGSKDSKWLRHEEVVNLVRQSGSHLELTLVTPINTSMLETPRPSSTPSSPGTPMRMQSPGESVSSHSVKSNRSRLSAPWIFIRKGSKEKQEKPEKSKEFEDGDLFLR